MSTSVDLRSDTVTRPTGAMRDAMMSAELGDDVLGDDPTVKHLEERVAAMLGKEAACFVPSGSMANQLCIRSQTEPGDEIIAHRESHVYVYEAGAWAAISGCSIHLLDGKKGVFCGQDILDGVRPDDAHFPRTRLVCAENTHNRGGGSVWSVQQLRDVTDTAASLGLRTHLDGARLWNAHVASGVALDELALGFDTVSVCFSKGLGAPVGSAAVGSTETIGRARRFRKMFGGGMRQSGILAGAALHALDHHIDRLALDHEHAQLLAQAVSELPGFSVDAREIETNIVYMNVQDEIIGGGAAAVVEKLDAMGVRVLAVNDRTIRAVTSLEVDALGVDRAIQAFRGAVSGLAV